MGKERGVEGWRSVRRLRNLTFELPPCSQLCIGEGSWLPFLGSHVGETGRPGIL